MLAGELPFSGDNAYALIQSIILNKSGKCILLQELTADNFLCIYGTFKETLVSEVPKELISSPESKIE
jgi:hypothetical protein